MQKSEKHPNQKCNYDIMEQEWENLCPLRNKVKVSKFNDIEMDECKISQA
jgi:hypothetical protein